MVLGLIKIVNQSIKRKVDFTKRVGDRNWPEGIHLPKRGLENTASYGWAPAIHSNCPCLHGTSYLSRQTDLNKIINTFRHRRSSLHYPLLNQFDGLTNTLHSLYKTSWLMLSACGLLFARMFSSPDPTDYGLCFPGLSCTCSQSHWCQLYNLL